MKVLTFFKFFGFVIIFLTTILLPLSLLDSSLEDISKELTNWSGENKIFNSILVISALTADVFLPVPNGLTNTLAGAILGFYLSIPIIWIGLTLGSLVGFAIGKYAAKPFAMKLLSKEDLERSEEISKKFSQEGANLFLVDIDKNSLTKTTTFINNEPDNYTIKDVWGVVLVN